MQNYEEPERESWLGPFLRGVVRVFGIPGPAPGVSRESRLMSVPTAEEARYQDYLALKSDWEAVGNSLRRAIERHDPLQRENSPSGH